MASDRDAKRGGVTGFYANVRSLRQAAGDVRRQIPSIDADIFVLAETHLKGDPVKRRIPAGYKAISRLDRSKHGDGLFCGVRAHLLATDLDLSRYCIPKVAEMVRFELDGVNYIGCYTPNSQCTCVLIDQCTQYLLDHPSLQVVFIGDFNVHKQDWICSSSPTDVAGRSAEELCVTFGLNQRVNFPTRGSNTLDLMMSPFSGQAAALANAGSSDHLAVVFEIQIPVKLKDAPAVEPVYDWEHAPWNHINGAISRYLSDWDPNWFSSADEAQRNLDEWLQAIFDRYIKSATPVIHGYAPWWSYRCEMAFKYKMKAFRTAASGPDRYVRAVRWNKRVQRKAFRVFKQKLQTKLLGMKSSDPLFWDLVKDIGSLNTARSSAAPDADELADHFAEKMTSGKHRSDPHFEPNYRPRSPLSNFKIHFKHVLRCLSVLDPSKSANGVGPRFLKRCAAIVAPPLYRLFKMLVRTARFPADWKVGRVTPVHKRGSLAERSNYRPITVLINCESVFEDVTKPQFEVWVTKSIPDWQFGFVSKHGMLDYGVALSITLQDCLERRGQGILIATGIKGAFDRC